MFSYVVEGGSVASCTTAGREPSVVNKLSQKLLHSFPQVSTSIDVGCLVAAGELLGWCSKRLITVYFWRKLSLLSTAPTSARNKVQSFTINSANCFSKNTKPFTVNVQHNKS